MNSNELNETIRGFLSGILESFSNFQQFHKDLHFNKLEM